MNTPLPAHQAAYERGQVIYDSLRLRVEIDGVFAGGGTKIPPLVTFESVLAQRSATIEAMNAVEFKTAMAAALAYCGGRWSRLHMPYVAELTAEKKPRLVASAVKP